VSETDLYTEILTKYSRGDTRLFRQNAGLAWQGTVIKHTPQQLILAHPRPFKMGTPGISDLGGWTTMAVLGEGGLVPAAIYVAIECKWGRRRATTEQEAFIDVVQRAGGRAGIARSVEDAGHILYGFDHRI
jgi:VRR-NUC domain